MRGRRTQVERVPGKAEATAFFRIHRDAPETVKEALRLLTYTGIVSLLDTWVARNPQRNRDEVFYQLGLPSGKRGKADLIFGSNRKRPFDKKIQ